MARFSVLVHLLVVVLHAFVSVSSEDDDLTSVVVLYRHGDRAPIRPYKNDPYGEAYWPLGFGQLTNLGKKRQYALGQWLRKRYNDFLPATYNKKYINIKSSNVDRCLMSAQLNLAGLYPPEGNQVWNKNLRWQPIPIHTKPEAEDAILAQSRPCPKYDKLFEQVVNEEPFSTLSEKYKEQMEVFSEASGEDIDTLEKLLDLYNTVYIENLYNLTLPDWTESLLTEEMEQLSGEAWSSYAYTEDLARLRSGPLINLILDHFEDIRNDVKDTPNFLMLSGHDSTIAPLLTALQVFDKEWPNYASSVIFELRQGQSKDFINILYRNPTEVVNLTLPNCDFDCDFGSFQKLLAPIRVGINDWDKECQDM